MADKNEMQQKFESKLAEYGAEIDRLQAKAKEASAEMREKYEQQIQDLQEKRSEAQVQLDKFKESSESAAESMKAGMQAAWQKLGNAVEEARSQFR